MTDPLTIRLNDIERRVRDLERAARSSGGRSSPPSPAVARPSIAPPVPGTRKKVVPPTPTPAPVVPEPPKAASGAETGSGVGPTSASRTPPTEPSEPTARQLAIRERLPTRPVAPEPPAKQDRAPIDWERFVATRIVPIGGAIALMIAAALLVRLMINAGLLTDAGKCALGAGLGALLIGAGELVRRRVNAIASAGLSGAGIGAIYISIYGASAWYGLIGPGASLVLLVATSALGIVIAGWSRLRSIAVLSLLGGYAAPFLLAAPSPSPFVLPVHALVLLSAGLWLSAWRPATFLLLRPLAWWGTVIVGTVWAGAQGGFGHLGALTVFLAGFWLIVHAGLTLGAFRLGRAETRDDDDAETAAAPYRDVRGIITSFATTLWAVPMGVIATHQPGATVDAWAVTGIGVLATIGLFVVLAGHLRTLRDAPRTEAERLGVGLAAQAGALLIATVAYAFVGTAQPAIWLAMGVAFVLAGRWTNAKSLDIYGVVLLAIGTLRIVTWDALRILPTTPGVDLLGLRLTEWSALMLGAGVAWMMSARLELVRRFGSVPPVCFSVIAMALFALAAIHPAVTPGALGGWWLLLAIGGALISNVERRFHTDLVALAILGGSAVLWAIAYPLEWGAHTGPAMLHPGLLHALGLAGAMMGWRTLTGGGSIPAGRRMGEELGWIVASLVPIGLTLAFLATSLEAARVAPMIAGASAASRAAVSIWWAVFASGLIVGGFRHQASAARRIGLGLLLVAALKTGIVDLRGVPELWRLLSFLGIGVLMSAVAVGYFHAQQLLEKRPAS